MAFRSFQSLRRIAKTSRHLPLKTSLCAAIQQNQKRFVSQDMENAKKRVTQLTEDPGNEVKLQMYALFKQVRKKNNYICS